jgi:uncharacterized protein
MAVSPAQGRGKISRGASRSFTLRANGVERPQLLAGRQLSIALVRQDRVKNIGHDCYHNGNIAPFIVTAQPLFVLDSLFVESQQRDARRIGVISDTHIPHRIKALPDAVFRAFEGCDLILHAGDLEDPGILCALSALAPVLAVRGNLHWQFATGTHDQDLPLGRLIHVYRNTLWMTHGHISFGHSVIDKATGILARRDRHRVNDALVARLRGMRPENAGVVIFGHSHLSTARSHDGALFFNPGSVAAQERKFKEGPRVGRLLIADDGRVTPEWEDVR